VREVIATGRGRYGDARLASDDLRVYVAPLSDSGGPAAGGAVAVAASTRDLEQTLHSVRLFVLAAAIVAAAAAATVLALLMGRALAPLGRLTRVAAEIDRTGDPHRRLPQPETDDEVGRLARTLNGMLGSLERAGEAERRFVADASHELRTPLTALVGNVAYLARYGASDELVAELEQDTRRLARLADDLLTLSREEGAAPPDEIVSLDELARAVEGVEVVAPAPVTVRGDRSALERAVDNLVENARRHGRGRITVAASAQDGLALLTSPTRGWEWARTRLSRRSTGSGAGAATAPAQASAWPSSVPRPNATAAAPTSRRRGSRSRFPVSEMSQSRRLQRGARRKRKERREPLAQTLDPQPVRSRRRRPLSGRRRHGDRGRRRRRRDHAAAQARWTRRSTTRLP
jgi:HAMP domain-containing protein